jgi:CheY-like chemotaxis protein
MHAAAKTNPDAPAIRTVLVVDDEVLIRLAIVEELRAAGLMAVEAASGDEAILILRTANTIGLVVTDVHMPGNTDGFALIAWLRQEMPHVKVIVISGRAVTTDVADAGYSKPFDMSALVHRVRDLLSGTPGQS